MMHYDGLALGRDEKRIWGFAMPVHDWTRVDAGIFHDFHLEWIRAIKRELNHGVLPAGYYALAEQITGPLGPDVLTLRSPTKGVGDPVGKKGSIALADRMPKAWYHSTAEIDLYASKANAIVIHHVSDHKIVAMIEIVSPGNKGSRRAIDAFVRKAEEALASGIHLLIIDLFPPGPRDPQGIHPEIWQGRDDSFALPPDKPLTCAAYAGGPMAEAFVEPIGLGDTMPDMPLFLTPDDYVDVPLAKTYDAALEGVPAFWQEILTKTA